MTMNAATDVVRNGMTIAWNPEIGAKRDEVRINGYSMRDLTVAASDGVVPAFHTRVDRRISRRPHLEEPDKLAFTWRGRQPRIPARRGSFSCSRVNDGSLRAAWIASSVNLSRFLRRPKMYYSCVNQRDQHEKAQRQERTGCRGRDQSPCCPGVSSLRECMACVSRLRARRVKNDGEWGSELCEQVACSK